MAWRQVTDGGLETELIFHRGFELPGFAAYPLLRTDEGRAVLQDYYAGYARIAVAAGAGLRLEAPTWRANPDWGAGLGDDATALADVNRAAIDLLHDLADEWSDRLDDVTVSGLLGPRGDGYRPDRAVDPDEAAEYHLPQLQAFAAAGADAASVLTLTDPAEAIGVSRAAATVGLPLIVSFTVETDGRLPGGQSLAEAVAAVDTDQPPAGFMINCAHPEHVLPAFDGDSDPSWPTRVLGLRVNASRQSHAELDEADTLDEGELAVLVPAHRRLESHLPALEVVGGCCGTDARHVSALWDGPDGGGAG